MNILFMQNNFGTKGCMYCEGECNKECLSKEEPTMITDWLAEHGDPEIYKKVEKQLELEEAAKREYEVRKYNSDFPFEPQSFKLGAKWQADKMYTEEDMSEAHFQGWVTRERFDDLSPDIIYPQGLDYEEKREYAFNLWLDKYKKK